MKALDKAQAEKAKAEGAKVKQEEYTLKNKKIEASEEKTIAVNEASNLSLSPPKESLISKQKKLVKAKAILVEQKK